MWVFGYGSIIWKVDFPYTVKTVGYIKGYLRKFYQLSMDQRGTPDNPGRVVTIIPDSVHSRVWGMAYRIPDDCIEQVFHHLDIREKGGYIRKNITFFPLYGHPPFETAVYIGQENNEHFASGADEDGIALQIIRAVGTSGTNVEYLLNLAKSIRAIAPLVDDQHLYNIEEKVLKLLKDKDKLR